MFIHPKYLVVSLIGLSVLTACKGKYSEPKTNGDYQATSYGTPKLCGDGQSWASESEVIQLENSIELAENGDTIILPAGCFKMNNQLTVDSKSDLQIRGAGIDKTFLDFSNVDGKDGIAISGGSNILISDLQVSEASKNGIKADGVEGIIIRDVATVWLEVPRARDEDGNLRGTYGIYPVQSQNVLIEDTWSYGSADAGIYVGQSIGAVIRNNVAEKNIAGIEVENSANVDVYDNLAIGNTGGVLLFDLPGATTIGRLVNNVRIFNNDIRDNNLTNYVEDSCESGIGACGVVGIVPPGTGMVILTGTNGEIFNNTITNHDSLAVAMASYLLVNDDPNAYNPNNGKEEGAAIMQRWNPVPTNMYIHDNVITNVGSRPNGVLIDDIVTAYHIKHQAFPNVFYDGAGESLIRAQLFSELKDALNYATQSEGWNYLTEFNDKDSNCVINNQGASVGVLVDNQDPTAIGRYMTSPENADFLYQEPHKDLLTAGCESKQPLAVNTVTINGVKYGYNIDSSTTTTPDGNTSQGIEGNKLCLENTQGDINWQAILSEPESFGKNCTLLSQYRLFKDASDPTQNLNIEQSGKGTLYQLNVELFTDYARKYRFVVMPEDVAAEYRSQEIIDFPVGTVLIKTFTLPKNTADTTKTNEELIETRLLIRRNSGWVALPYVWNDDKTDAYLTAVSVPFERSITHDNKSINFTYEVPSRNECTLCHKVEKDIADPDGSTQQAGFSPIGPKIRNLNGVHTDVDASLNQLTHWENLNLFTSALPDAPDALPKVPMFDTEKGIETASLTPVELEDLSKAYLDINCAHCHRPEGKSAGSPFKLEYWRNGTENMGLCARGITYHKGPSPYVIIPGDAEKSILYHRLALESGNLMPELGRHVVHQEGIEVIAKWINTMDITDVACAQE